MFDIKEKNVLTKFYDNYVTQVTVMKSGWKGMYLVIYEHGEYEDAKLKLLNEYQVLNEIEDLTIDDLMLL